MRPSFEKERPKIYKAEQILQRAKLPFVHQSRYCRGKSSPSSTIEIFPIFQGRGEIPPGLDLKKKKKDP